MIVLHLICFHPKFRLMISSEQFKSFYDSKLLPVLQEIEVERKVIARSARNLAIFPTLIVCAVTLVLYVNTEPVIPIGASVFTFLIGLGIYWLINRKKIRAFKHRFKMEVVKTMISSIDQNLDYFYDRCISESDYRASKIFMENHTSYRGDDLVTGTIGKTAIRFSELHTVKRVKSGKETKDITIFRGIFFIADFNKHFKGATVVLPDVAENLLGNFVGGLVQKMTIGRDQLVKLEDPEFERAFVVYSNDQVEARYILSPALMRRLLDFRAKARRAGISIAFNHSNVFIAIPISSQLFEAHVLTTVLNFEVMKSYHEYLVTFIGIVEDLNLNNRIWTKE